VTIAEILKQSGKELEKKPGGGQRNQAPASGAEPVGDRAAASPRPIQMPASTPSRSASPSSTPPPPAPPVPQAAPIPVAVDWFETLSAKRRGWWESTQANNYERGIRQSTVEKYADPVHFLYELLQNAEDQGATQAVFSLDAGKLRFIHNGEPFTPQDVENITGLGNSDKPEQANKIGRFGIGFKSVFTVTARPRIYTYLGDAPFAFAIENLVVPVRIEDKNGMCKEGQTQFTLPFEEARAADTYQRIRERLKTLEADTLLFLKRLRRIHWTIDGMEEGILTAKREEGGRLVHLSAEVGPKGRPVKKPDVDYLVYSKEVVIQGADRRLAVSIAYRRENGRIVGEKGQATANVYFPTREKTGLKFRLHAPFLLNDSRANIKDNAPENTTLIRACAELFAQSLPDLKERGQLTADVLDMLPIREADFDGSPFRPLYDAMFNAARTLEILPTQTGSSKSHVRATRAKISDSRPLKNLFGEPQLTALYESTSRDPVCWLHESIQKTTKADLWNYLMRALEVDEVDANKVARRVETPFVTAQTDEWMVEFYAFLTDQPALWRAATTGRERGPLRNKPIIRLEEGTAGIGGATHVAPFAEGGTPNAYLPLKTDAVGFPTVKKALVRNAEAMKFLMDLGLKQPNVADRIAVSVLPRYYQTAPSVSEQSYAYDLRDIADAVTGLPQEGQERRDLCRKLLTHNIVRAVRADNPNVVGYKKPAEVYARTAENVEWFAGNAAVWLLCPTLEKHDRWPALQKAITAFSSGLFPALPRVTARGSDYNGYVDIVSSHGWHKRGLSGFDPEADIEGLVIALKTITPAKAKLLWRLLLPHAHTLAGVIESSTTKHFGSATRTEKPSTLGKACQEAHWLLHKETGAFHHPAKIRLADLPDDWDKRSPSAKEVALRLGLSNPEEQAAADKLGIPVDAFIRFAEAYKRDPRVVDQLVVRARPDLPTTETPYTERRAAKVAQEAEESDDIAYEKRERSVRASGGAVKSEADAYLREKYTNADGRMICQICENEMPFDREDGSPFFFSVPCLKEIEKEAKQNYLALCPLCAALYQYGNWGNAPGALRQAIQREPGPHFALYLAGEEETVWFHPHHLGDLKSVLSVVGVARPTKF
jgi:hypothetical protein